MDTAYINPKNRVLLAAASIAFVPLMAFSQNKAESSPPSSTAVSGQSTNSSTVTAGSGGSPPTGSEANANSEKANAQSKPKNLANAAAVLLLVPVNAPEQNQWKKKGSWAKFYDDQNYGGDNLTLIGPVDMAEMTGPFGINWNGKISSVETGPKTRVMVYDNQNFQDLVATFKPGQKSPDVSKKMGFFDEFGSVKIACDNLKAKAATKGETNGAGKS